MQISGPHRIEKIASWRKRHIQTIHRVTEGDRESLRGPFATPGAGKPDRRVATSPNSSSTLVQMSGAVMSSGGVVSRQEFVFTLIAGQPMTGEALESILQMLFIPKCFEHL